MPGQGRGGRVFPSTPTHHAVISESNVTGSFFLSCFAFLLSFTSELPLSPVLAVELEPPGVEPGSTGDGTEGDSLTAPSQVDSSLRK